MAISDKLLKLNTIKTQIKTILSENGVEVSDIFETYPEQISSLVDTLKNKNISVIDGSAITPIE